jgi:nitroimidazol reductase NimA-like FMN-containing flavoprotein (pyridoxamine 5'-phosphate oxidase superfamily)
MQRTERRMKELWDILDGTKVCYLGVVDDLGPYVVPMVFGHDGCSIFLHSAGDGRKVRAIERDPRVCLTFAVDVEVIEGEIPCRWGMRFRSVVVEGQASFPKGERKRYALERIYRHVSGRDSGEMPLSEGTLAIEVSIERMHGKEGGKP